MQRPYRYDLVSSNDGNDVVLVREMKPSLYRRGGARADSGGGIWR